MKIPMQFRTNVNYMSYISDCLIEICNTHSVTFGYQSHFFSQFTFKLNIALISFDCLFTVSIRTKSDDGKHRNKSCAGDYSFF